MKKELLSQADAQRLRDLYKDKGRPVPTDIRLIDGRILSYQTNDARRDATIALYEIADANFRVDYDGDPSTVEIGVSQAGVALITLMPGDMWID